MPLGEVGASVAVPDCRRRARYRGSMPLEVTGDSARGDAFAFARLVVDGEHIVEADAPGMARPLAGLTLLEAAAVPGETLRRSRRCRLHSLVRSRRPR